MNIAKYTIQAINDLLVVITDDLDEDSPSVTNSAGAVIQDLNSKVGGLGSRRVYYRDSIKRYDELRHENGCFVGFAPCKPAQQDFLNSLG